MGEMTFETALRAHLARWPKMEPQDCVKLAYQSEFGPEHMVSSPADALASLVAEYRQMPETGLRPLPPEPIGGGLCRLHLSRDAAGAWERELPLTAGFFTATAARHRGSMEGLARKLDVLAGLDLPGMADFLERYRRDGCPSLHHSSAFRAAYDPHYRVVGQDHVNYSFLFTALAPLALSGRPALVAIDGRCGSGKTGLARLIAQVFPCNVFHMDDFFLPFELRTLERLAAPGGNVDYERADREVLSPLRRGEDVLLRPFDCHTGALKPAERVPFRPLNLIEGSYAHHPALAGRYDLKIFLTCGQEEQRRRLLEREGPQGVIPFLERWIPLEERYFDALGIEDAADLSVDTTEFFR